MVAEANIPSSRPTTSQAQTASSCCQPKPVQAQVASCCSAKEPPKPVPPQKSCCSGSKSTQTPQPQFSKPSELPMPAHPLATFPQYPGPLPQTPYNMPNPGNNFMAMAPPYNFNTPIYNHMASVYQPPMSMPMTPMASHTGTYATEHNCHCGDSCSCFGCAAHPNNATMIEYIRSMHQYMSTGQFGSVPPPVYDLPSYPHQVGYGAEVGLAYNQTSANFLATGQMTFHANMNTTMSMPHTPLAVTSPWLHDPIQTPVQTAPTNEQQFFGAAHSASPVTVQESPVTLEANDIKHSPAFADSPSETKSEDAETLSPSSYFWQEMVLPGCNDETGTCQCGDGCSCVGCLTHGGHNGVSLDAATNNEDESFPDFTTPTDTISNHMSHFPVFSDAPT